MQQRVEVMEDVFAGDCRVGVARGRNCPVSSAGTWQAAQRILANSSDPPSDVAALDHKVVNETGDGVG